MKLRAVTTIAITIMCLTTTGAQKTSEVPKPGPEVAKLGYFLGDWKVNAELKLNRSSAREKFVGTAHNEWMGGGFFLVSHSEQISGVQSGKTLTVYGYDPIEKTYSYYAFNSIGQIERAKGRLEGKTWIWDNEHKMGDRILRGRFLIETISPTSYKFKYEMASGAAGWTTIMEGTAAKMR